MQTECEHGEPRGVRYCAFCRRAGIRGEADAGPSVYSDPTEWERAAKHVIWELARSRQPFTSEDVTAKIGFPDTYGHRANGPNNRIGLLLNKVAKQYGMKGIDRKPATNPQAHGRLLTVWQGR